MGVMYPGGSFSSLQEVERFNNCRGRPKDADKEMKGVSDIFNAELANAFEVFPTTGVSQNRLPILTDRARNEQFQDRVIE